MSPLHSCSNRSDTLAPFEHSWPYRYSMTLHLQHVCYYISSLPLITLNPRALRNLPRFIFRRGKFGCLWWFLLPNSTLQAISSRRSAQWPMASSVCLFFSCSDRNVSKEKPLPGPWALASAHAVSVDAVFFPTPLPNVKNSTICAGHADFSGRTVSSIGNNNLGSCLKHYDSLKEVNRSVT